MENLLEFEYQGKILSALEVRRMVRENKKINVIRGKANLDSYCTPDRILGFFNQGLIDYLFYIPPKFSFISQYLHRSYLFEEGVDERWWVKQKIVQFCIITLPLLFAIIVLVRML